MDSKRNRYLSLAACMLMGVAIGFVVAYLSLSGVPAQGGIREEVLQGTEKYQEIMTLVDNYYIGDDVDMTQVNDTMAAGVIAGLGDRWSYYVPAAEYQAFQNNIDNAMVGVGITITAAYDEAGGIMGYEITEVISGGPAEAAGVMAGDILIAVERQSIAGMSVTEVKTMVQGEEGTQVLLGLQRGDATVNLTVSRETFTIIPAKGMMLDGDVGYIIIENFDAGCYEAVKGYVEELTAQGAETLLFDVRNNGGGLKSELIDLLDYLLPEGTIFHTVNYAGEEEISKSDASCIDMPMAVLVNSSSYSAAEYFACAIQEYGVGKVIGSKTTGKGYYQLGMALSDGSAVNLSIGKYYTPSGISLIDVGVTPDVELDLTKEDAILLAQKKLSPTDDPQIQAALGCLK